MEIRGPAMMDHTQGSYADCSKLIRSGWVGFYHYIVESPEDGDLHYDHYFLSCKEMGEKFPHLKLRMEK